MKKLELTEEYKELIIELVEKGCTDKEVLQGIGVSNHKFYDWLNENPDFRAQLKKIRRPLNKNVEASLYQRTQGYDYEEICEIMNISYANCRTMISRAKDSLRQKLEPLAQI